MPPVPPRVPEITTLRVRLGRRAVGTLTLLPGERTLFAFGDEYLDDPQRPVLSLSFKDRFGGIVAEQAPTRVRVPPFFSNLLPEGHLREYLAARAGVKGMREFFLLQALGKDLPGAVVVEPDAEESRPPPSPHGGHDDERRSSHDDARDALRFSLAGVQLKLSAVMEAGGGLTIPAQGAGGSWIVKLPSARFEGVAENEFSMMRLAARLGLDVPEVRLVDLDAVTGLPEGIGTVQGKALAVRRFDRAPDGVRVHAEDFAQIFGLYPERKYARGNYRSIAEVVWAEAGEPGVVELVRRLVFNALIGNADMHMKNWSMIYPDGRNAMLAPAYDLLSTIAYLPDERMALNLVRSKRFADLTIAAFTHFAGKARLPEHPVLSAVRDTAGRFRDEWPAAKRELPVAERVARAIDAHLVALPLASGR